MNNSNLIGYINGMTDRSVVYWEEHELNRRSKLQISYTTAIIPPLIISWRL